MVFVPPWLRGFILADNNWIDYCLMLFQLDFMVWFLFFITIFFPAWISSIEPPQRDLMDDLLIVDYWNRQINDRLPVTYNHLLQGGYFNMPSARMGEDGEIGFGYSNVPPYVNYNLRCQIAPQLEISGNYRIFKGVDDPILTPLGFGDLSDKGANVKFAIFLPEDSEYTLPGLAVGYEDFIGTQNFRARYIVLTQVLRSYHMEISLGYGQGRIRGLFGGVAWMPFRCCDSKWISGLSFAAEYDATPYKDSNVELHPKGRRKRSPINFGVKYRLLDYFDFSASYIRGDAFAFSASTFYNFGYTEGLLPKIDDPLPCNSGQVGVVYEEDLLIEELRCHLEAQGFDLLQIWKEEGPCGEKVLRTRMLNNSYVMECEVRERLTHLFACLIPDEIDEVIAVIESDGFPIQEYIFRIPYLKQYICGQMGVFEVNLLSPLREVTYPDPCTSSQLYYHRRNLWNMELLPKVTTYFGSSKGKFKYALGLSLDFNGFLWGDVYYTLSLGYYAFSSLGNLTGIDRLNPSQIINVRSDLPEYIKHKQVTVDEAFLQKNWNMGKGWYARIAGGLFEVEYGGLATEVLYAPLDSSCAFGVEAALCLKRTHTGIGFSNKVRKLHGLIPTYEKFIGKQYFFSFYHNWEALQMDFKVKIGKFLANDYGAGFEISRYFPSGLKLYIWYTWTNANDNINGKNYHDKGVGFSMPLDIFYTHSERERFGDSMSAWLRDVGVSAYTGKELYDLISAERE